MTASNRMYSWQGTNAQGASISGQSAARSPALIRAQLRQRGIRPGRIASVRQPLWQWRRPLDGKALSQFSRQLATLVKAGVALLQALDVVAQSSANPAMASLLGAIKADIAAGSSLATALRRHPHYFDRLYCNLVDAGEQSGSLEVVLAQVAALQEQRQALRMRLKKAMTYPLLVLLVGFGVSALLLLEVVPRFQSLFGGFGAELPAFTQQVIGLSQWLGAHLWWLLITFCSACAALVWGYRHKPSLRLWLVRVALRLPVLGSLLRHAALARFARTLSTSFAAGVPLVEALGPVAGACGNLLYEQAVHKVREELASGLALNVALRASELFPALVVQMCAIGETAGTLDDMLARIASHYEQAIDHLLDTLTALLEPLIVLILGLLVGSLVIAMYLPIFQLGNVI
ncbi:MULTISPECIES: type II secretion system F family protein [Pseudomonas]|uniref:Type II secretion system protein F n=2 Tax=Pseudomonas TaxID=286 RepID=A0AAN2L4G7_PSEFL|nr:type II secretion system F family protein [Pseudomonas sp. Irchel 3F5]